MAHDEKVSIRINRVADQIREEVAQFLTRGIKDPRLGFVTVTHVRVTGDLKSAKIFYSAYGSDKEKEDTRIVLEDSTRLVRSHLAKNLRMKFIPTVEFVFDESLEDRLRLEGIFGQIEQERRGQGEETE